MGAAARAKYRQLFAADAVMPLLKDFYRRVVDGRETQGAEVPYYQWASDAGAAGTNGCGG